MCHYGNAACRDQTDTTHECPRGAMVVGRVLAARIRMATRTPSWDVTVACPVCDGGEVDVVLEYEPEEHGWGADADGNRGITVPGYFTVARVAETCSDGCTRDREQDDAVERAAEQAAKDFNPEW